MKRLLAPFLALLCATAAWPAHAESFSGRVVGIADGDTLTVLVGREERKVRLFAIDAPEMKGQPFGMHAKMQLSQCAYDKVVTVEWSEHDRYGRIVGKVIADGRDCNLGQIEAGMAWHFTQYAKRQTTTDRHAYAEAERRAREERRGLWRDPSPQPPWEFRRREAKAAANGEPTEAERLRYWTAITVLATTCVLALYHWRYQTT